MISRCIFFASIMFLLIVHAAGQDSSTISMKFPHLKVGLYLSQDDFFRKKTTLVSPFVMEPIYKKRENQDSFVHAYSCRLQDPSVNIQKVYGLFDGQKLYMRGGGNTFSHIHGLGKHPFFVYMEDINYIDVGSLLGLLVTVVDGAVTPAKEKILYYNKKRKVVEATIIAIILLLKEDKDLEAEFRKEKVKNTQTFKKYLLKMNERYPY